MISQEMMHGPRCFLNTPWFEGLTGSWVFVKEPSAGANMLTSSRQSSTFIKLELAILHKKDIYLF